MALTYLDLQNRVRAITRDFSNSIFRQQDVNDFINEGIDRFKEVIPQFSGMVYLVNNGDVPALLPDQYHAMLAIFASARLFMQDERNYQATTYMNEFETKLEELHANIQAGIITIKDSTGTALTETYTVDYVADEYFDPPITDTTLALESTNDVDLGVDNFDEDGLMYT